MLKQHKYKLIKILGIWGIFITILVGYFQIYDNSEYRVQKNLGISSQSLNDNEVEPDENQEQVQGNVADVQKSSPDVYVIVKLLGLERAGWSMGNVLVEDNLLKMAEFYPPRETSNKWSEVLIVRTWYNIPSNQPLEKVLSLYKPWLEGQLRGSKLKTTYAKNPDGKQEIKFVAEVPQQKTVIIGKIMFGTDNGVVHVLQYTIKNRRDMAKKLDLWYRELGKL